MTKQFSLNGHEFIELNKLLKLMRLVGSGGEANMAIDNGLVEVNNTVETRRRRKLRAGDRVNFNSTTLEICE